MTAVRVAYDVTPVISGSTGIARYASQLAAALEDEGVALRRFAIGRRSHPVPPHTRHLPLPARVVDQWWKLAGRPGIEVLARDAHLVHATGMLIPRTRLPLVVTVHDLAALRHPELHPPRHVSQQRQQLSAVSRAAAIVTVSQATADDLASFDADPSRIFVAPLGVSRGPAPAPEPSIATGRLLAVGETSPRKRLDLLLRALAGVDPSIGLVVAGPPAADEQRLSGLIAELGLERRVTRLGRVGDPELAALYRDALALCFPSVAEGFGLPVLEAMAAGLPVLARDMPVMRELTGGSAILLPGDDPAAWAGAIERVALEDGLRARLSVDGRRRAAQFSWARTAAGTLEAYRHVLGSDAR